MPSWSLEEKHPPKTYRIPNDLWNIGRTVKALQRFNGVCLATFEFNRCRVELSKYVGPKTVDGLCANLHHRATGGWPGHAPGVEQAMAEAKKKEKKK